MGMSGNHIQVNYKGKGKWYPAKYWVIYDDTPGRRRRTKRENVRWVPYLDKFCSRLVSEVIAKYEKCEKGETLLEFCENFNFETDSPKLKQRLTEMQTEIFFRTKLAVHITDKESLQEIPRGLFDDRERYTRHYTDTKFMKILDAMVTRKLNDKQDMTLQSFWDRSSEWLDAQISEVLRIAKAKEFFQIKLGEYEYRRLPRSRQCGTCNGSGKVTPKSWFKSAEPCKNCNESGRTQISHDAFDDWTRNNSSGLYRDACKIVANPSFSENWRYFETNLTDYIKNNSLESKIDGDSIRDWLSQLMIAYDYETRSMGRRVTLDSFWDYVALKWLCELIKNYSLSL